MYRPILTIPKTKAERYTDWLGGGLFVGAILYVAFQWGNLPSEIPGHFNGAGEVDRWGSKFEILILPLIGFFLWALISVLEKAPYMHNYPKRINESNVEAFYLNSRKLANVIKNICLLIFAVLQVQIVRVALGQIDSLGWWFLPFVLMSTLIPIIVGIVKSSKIK
ncbi:MAG: DUF1648 domain-containing protein [Lysinibacillus sp.]